MRCSWKLALSNNNFMSLVSVVVSVQIDKRHYFLSLHCIIRRGAKGNESRCIWIGAYKSLVIISLRVRDSCIERFFAWLAVVDEDIYEALGLFNRRYLAKERKTDIGSSQNGISFITWNCRVGWWFVAYEKETERQRDQERKKIWKLTCHKRWRGKIKERERERAREREREREAKEKRDIRVKITGKLRDKLN